MRMRPLDDRLLIKIEESVETTKSGIIIPDTAKEKPTVGVVIEVGTDEALQELIKVGDRVVFAKYGGEEISMDGVDYKVIQRADVLGIIEG